VILFGGLIRRERTMALEIMGDGHSIEALRQEACRCTDARQSRRLLGLAMALEGASRQASAKAAGMTRQTLRDWVIRYNELGVEGLKNKVSTGRPPRLNQEQLLELDALVEQGPDVEVHGVTRWRCVDLKGMIASRFDVDLSEDQIGRIMKQRGYRRLSVRPQHPLADAAAQETFKKTSPPS
jgi:transposase